MFKRLLSKLTGELYIRGYDIGDPIFEGAFSNIYRCVRTETGEEVALKVLTKAGEKIARLLENDSVARWEGQLLKELEHPNIIKCLEYGTGKHYWLAMEFIHSNLGDYIGRCNNEGQENDLIKIIEQTVSAMAYIHRKGLVHRDVCLGNILLTPDKTVKLIDFGMTIPAGSKVVKGRVGTPSYMAPEMIKRWQYEPGADIYSLGIVMYELITGKKPFWGETQHARMTKSLNTKPTPPSNFIDHCSEDLEKIILRCMSKDPQKRPSDATELDRSIFLLCKKRGLD
ncbi:MAG: serine/threonine protein kinase [Candidatus Brocadiia bacterium]